MGLCKDRWKTCPVKEQLERKNTGRNNQNQNRLRFRNYCPADHQAPEREFLPIVSLVRSAASARILSRKPLREGVALDQQ
jgi:hypothetical protein